MYTALSAESQYAASGYVDVLTGESESGPLYNFLSGTLIAPDWVLTAAHGVTVNESGPAYPASVITFGQGTDFALPAADSVSQVIVEDGYDGDFYAGDDLALLQLSTPITTVAPAQLYRSNRATLLGQTATVIGYGYSGTGLTGDTGPIGTRRGMQNVIDTFGGDTVQGGTAGDPMTYDLTGFSNNTFFTDFDAPETASWQNTNIMGSPSPLPLEGATAPGDSGGGVFVTVNSQTYLAGVTSFSYNFNTTPTGEYGDVDGYTWVNAGPSLGLIDSTLEVTSNWNSSGGGSWAGLSNWDSGGIPEYMAATANFGSAIQTSSTVTLDAAWTVGTVSFNSTNSYTLAPGTGGSLTLFNGGNSLAALTDNCGSHFITAPMSFSSNVVVTVANAGDVLTLSGPISGTGGMTVAGSGIVRLAAGSGTTTLSALTVSSGATLDITNNKLLINFGTPANDPESAIVAALSSAYSGGKWTGTGITSSTAAGGGAIPLLSVGYADGNVDFNTPAGPNQILVRYTLAGDANLDGQVNFADLLVVAQNFNKTGEDWAGGNFVYNPTGLVNFADLLIVAQNFNQVLPPGGLANELGGGGTIPLATSVSIPEPSALMMLIGAGGLMVRRRQDNKKKIDGSARIE